MKAVRKINSIIFLKVKSTPGDTWYDDLHMHSRVLLFCRAAFTVRMNIPWARLTEVPRARQIVLLGSDGRRYMFLAKPQDDLRKDSRMMEVAGVVNHLFTGQPASRRRNLYLRRRAR